MSVKGKVKRCNKKIAELEKELKKSRNGSYYIPIDRTEEKMKQIKDNFIKLLVAERLPLEHEQCCLRISEERLKMMDNAYLKVEYNPYDRQIEFKVRI